MIADAFPAMGTTVAVSAACADDIEATRRWFEHAERVCSRFDPDSELTRLNADPRIELPLPALLAPVFHAADRVRLLTDGLVDIGLGGEVIRWGYDRTFAQVKDLDRTPVARFQGSWGLDQGRLRRTPGVRFDLGGVAKGWAADQAIERGLAEIVSAGGDIASRHPECEVLVEGPDGDTVATVQLGVGALATSTTSRRRWKVGGEPAHHLIDPRTASPANSPVISATAVARTAVLAEAAAKAMLLRGADGLAWASARGWIDGGLVVWHDGSVYATTGLEIAA
ncbi:MAG TPA: FAD:protein FMN transferase [Acidimicrobiia bacterium]|nr:FAD:protein FMN transferase [Acidimicrobiia bacterium]